ncbi:MAG: hypothetical protein IJ449_08465 [Clostridia bacterium]|nr:hypothetical protein [Clostridia bacterium]
MKTVFQTMSARAVLVLLVCAVLSLSAFAADGGDGTPEVLTYTYTDDAPEVDAPRLFLAIYDGEYDIRIEGARASWTFYYENIFRTTDKWREFSSAVSVNALSSSGADSGFAAALAGEDAYLLDFRDGDLYPGTADVEIQLSDVLSAGIGYAVYEYLDDGNGTVSVRPIAENLMLSSDGKLSLTLTEAHDFLIAVRTETLDAALSAYAYTPTVAESDDGFFAGAGIGWIVFFTAVGVVLVVLGGYLVTVHIMKKKRKAMQKKLPKLKK